MTPFAYFGIASSGVNLAINIAILFLVVIYLALIYWTYADATRRVSDPMLVGVATIASLIPFVGVIVYVILRPPEFLEDVRERELEMQAAEARLHELNYRLCPHCDYEIDRDMVRCPSCLRGLRVRCATCSKPLDQAWSICPYCESEGAGAVPQPRRARRRRDSTPSYEAPYVASALAPAPAPGESRFASALAPTPAPSESRFASTLAPAPEPSYTPPAPAPEPEPAPAPIFDNAFETSFDPSLAKTRSSRLSGPSPTLPAAPPPPYDAEAALRAAERSDARARDRRDDPGGKS